MAGRIKGITVEIGGDTTGLDKALKGVNSTIKTTQSSLKDVNKLLKLDPANTNLVTQKQKLLKDAVNATKEKLEALKTAQEQARQQLENGTLGQDKYDALQREIIETEEELRRLQQEAETTSTALSKIDEAGKKFEKAGDAIAGAGRAVMPASAAVAGLGVAAVKTSADFDSAMSQVAAVSGATGDDFDALRDKAREMGSKTKFSASEAADAMNYMAMAGWKTEDMLGGIEGIMNLAAASGEDLRSGLRTFCRPSGCGIVKCQYECLHDGRDLQVLRSDRGRAWIFCGGYCRGDRPYGKCRYQILPGRYVPTDNHDKAAGRAETVR